jgi:hypothetical protein
MEKGSPGRKTCSTTDVSFGGLFEGHYNCLSLMTHAAMTVEYSIEELYKQTSYLN